MGLREKMGVNFLVTLRVPRVDLEAYRYLRKGRLNGVADEHFRERIAEFFRRFPYDEWYALNTEELEAYQKDYPDASRLLGNMSRRSKRGTRERGGPKGRKRASGTVVG